MKSATTIDWAAERLRRDEMVATQFLDWHLTCVQPPRRNVVQAAETYRQWCADARSALLHIDVANPADVEDFDQRWRGKAEASEIRAEASWAEVGAVLCPLALIVCAIVALADMFVLAAIAAAIAAVADLTVRKAKLALLVGPAGRKPPFWMTGALKR